MTNRYGYEDERRRGGYGIGGAERGYNQGGYGGRGSFEEGYRRGSYDRLLDTRERRRDTGDEEYGRFPEEDEGSWYERSKRHGDWGVGLIRESWGDEPRRFEPARGEEPRREPRGDWDLHRGLHRREWGRPEDFRGGTQEWIARGRGPGKAPKGYTRGDERIREDICERLMLSPYDSSEVEVTVAAGEVTLTGTVRSRADKWGIEDVAEVALGVQHVNNQIRVSRDESHRTILAGDTGPLHS
jgi:hypothetical protein